MRRWTCPVEKAIIAATINTGHIPAIYLTTHQSKLSELASQVATLKTDHCIFIPVDGDIKSTLSRTYNTTTTTTTELIYWFDWLFIEQITWDDQTPALEAHITRTLICLIKWYITIDCLASLLFDDALITPPIDGQMESNSNINYILHSTKFNVSRCFAWLACWSGGGLLRERGGSNTEPHWHCLLI